MTAPESLPPEPTHVDERGRVRMVDVGGKAITAREAVAEGYLVLDEAAHAALWEGRLKKGDAMATARVAGILAAKRTSDLIPLCHPLATTGIQIDIEPSSDPRGARVVASVRVVERTGAEMEALTAVTIALLTLYDMLKAVQKDMHIEGVRLLRKTK